MLHWLHVLLSLLVFKEYPLSHKQSSADVLLRFLVVVLGGQGVYDACQFVVGSTPPRQKAPNGQG